MKRPTTMKTPPPAKTRTIALVDCNNFYVSCERAFNPRLKARPVVVASNNDGCIVARSQEVKDLGIKMGTPLHEAARLIKRHSIAVHSSNYILYGDMSQRVMVVLHECAPDVAVYSIDEAFLDLTGLALPDREAHGRHIQRKVLQCLGIPTCVGIGASKTLAKAANWGAKHCPGAGGVMDLTEPAQQEWVLRQMDVSDVWGVGRRLRKKLKHLGIHTGWDLRCADAYAMRRRFNIVLERTVKELQGESCLPFEEDVAHNQQIVASRSFGRKVRDFDTILSAVTHHTCRAAAKLRQQDCVAGKLTVSIITNPFSRTDAQYYNARTLALPDHTSDSLVMMKTAAAALKAIYRPGFLYKKAGVMLSDIRDGNMCVLDLFDVKKMLGFPEGGAALMDAMDAINRRHGKGALRLGSEGFKKTWATRANFLSKRYTTHWAELPVVR